MDGDGGERLTAMLATLSATEARLLARWRKHRRPARTWILLATWLGSGWAYAAAAVVLLWAPSVRPLAATALGVLLANLVLVASKRLVRRDRPEAVGVAHFSGDHYSFPSGHATNAFGVAIGLGLAVPVSALPALGVAALIAASRVARGVHYPSDVVVGAALGSFAAATAASLVGL